MTHIEDFKWFNESLKGNDDLFSDSIQNEGNDDYDDDDYDDDDDENGPCEWNGYPKLNETSVVYAVRYYEHPEASEASDFYDSEFKTMDKAVKFAEKMHNEKMKYGMNKNVHIVKIEKVVSEEVCWKAIDNNSPDIQ